MCSDFSTNHNPISCIKCEESVGRISEHLLYCIECKIKKKYRGNHIQQGYCDEIDTLIPTHFNCDKCVEYDMHLRICKRCYEIELWQLYGVCKIKKKYRENHIQQGCNKIDTLIPLHFNCDECVEYDMHLQTCKSCCEI